MFNGIVTFDMLGLLVMAREFYIMKSFVYYFLTFFLCHISLYKSNVFVLLGVIGQG